MPAEMNGFLEYEQKVIGWIAEWSRRNSRDLTADTCINCGFTHGLGISGDDGHDLLRFLFTRSGVSFEEFEEEQYFGPELSIAALIFRPSYILRMLSGPKLTIRALTTFMYDRAHRVRE